MTLSAYSVVKNEAQFIGYGLMSILPYVDEVVYADGNSTDGTLELLDYISGKYADGKLKVFRDMDFKDLRADYVRVFNETMKRCTGEYIWYCHPDMVLTKPGLLGERYTMRAFAYYVNMRSFAGEDLGMEIVKGRTSKWKTIMRNEFDLHYWGVYGHPDEDMYFKKITGDEHKVFKDMRRYPYEVPDSGIEMWHFCECKPRKRREEKMKNVFAANDVIAQGIGLGPSLSNDTHMFDIIMNHPRVHLRNQKGGMFGDFEFVKRSDPLPEVFAKYKEEFDGVLGQRIA